jgi:hypothetical protein
MELARARYFTGGGGDGVGWWVLPALVIVIVALWIYYRHRP